MRHMTRWTVVFWLGLHAATAAAATDSGKLLRASDLREKPFNDAKVQGRLPAEAIITISRRQGSWAQVTGAGQQGWIKVLNIVSVSGKQGSAGLAELAKTLTTGSSGKESSTAVKGITEESLKKAAPAPAEVQYLETLGSSNASAQTFASKAGLKAQTVPFLPKAD